MDDMTTVPLQPHQMRVVEEKLQLDERRVALLAFLNTDPFKALDQAEKDRLRIQHGIMGVYSDILHTRISAFLPEKYKKVK